MSLRNARMAPPTGLLKSLCKSYCVAGLSVAVSVNGLHAQDNFLRLTTAQLRTSSILPQSGSLNGAEAKKEAEDKKEEEARKEAEAKKAAKK